MTQLCLQFAASSEQEMETSIDPAVAEPWGCELVMLKLDWKWQKLETATGVKK